MGRITSPRMEVVRFGKEDVIVTSGVLFFSMHVNDISTGDWYLILNGEGNKSFPDWNTGTPKHGASASDTLFLVYFNGGDWYDESYGYKLGGTYIADSTIAEHINLSYIWYGSGYGAGNVVFNTQGKSWSYYLDNGISLPRSN